jgi:hypothetical protein
MPKQFIAGVVALLLVLAASAWLPPRHADARDFEPGATAVSITDADFCFGPGNQSVGFACNSICFHIPDPSLNGPPITCPGPAASITFASSPTTVFCGSQSLLSVVVADARNAGVADDTLVTFTTDGGTVLADAATNGGLAFTMFTVPPKTSGVARIIATVGGVRAEKRIDVGCAS